MAIATAVRMPGRHPSVADERHEDQDPAPVTLSERLFKPGWPLAAILVPFPLWWVLGVSEWIVPAMVVPMTLQLMRRPAVLVPRGIGWWLAFLLWVAAGGFLLQVDALGAVADNSSTRMITFIYRLGWYLSITVVLLYVVNMRRVLSSLRIVRMVSCFFITITFGGVLGVVAPYFEFQSLVELLLPRSLTKYQLITSMVHPQAAQLQVVLGYVAPRPAAPFTFTNTWGLNFAITLPFFLLGWLGKDAGWRRWAAGPILVVAAVPFIYSLNRGLWGACIAMALFVAARAALTGRPGVLAGIVAGAVALAVLLAVSPLGNIVALRFSNDGSEEGRANLGTLAVRSVTATSPIVGLGSTRNVQGNFQSITGGSTAQCPRCSPPSLGTQGQLWLVVFSQGLVGLLLFFAFFARIFLRHIRLRSPVVTIALASMVAWGVTLPVYNSLGTAMLVLMVAVGLLCREGALDHGELPGPGDPSVTLLDRYTAALRSGMPVILVMGLLGAGAGYWWQTVWPSPYRATASVLLNEPPRYPSPGYARTNVDTDAQLVASKDVRGAAASASGESPSDIAENLTVTATPNTRVLHLHLTAPTAEAARSGVDAATEAFLDARTVRLEEDRKRELGRLQDTGLTLAGAVITLNRQVQSAKSLDPSGGSDPATALARDQRNQVLPQADAVARQSARIAGLSLSGGQQIAATSVTQSSDRLLVDLVSGLTAGVGLGAMFAVMWGAAGSRLRRVKNVRGMTGLPLLGRAPATPQATHAFGRLFGDRPMAYLAATESDSAASSVAAQLTETTTRPKQRAGAVIVASGQTRIEQVLACEGRLRLQGIPVRGVLLATGAVSGRSRRSPIRALRLPGVRRPAILERASRRRRQGR